MTMLIKRLLLARGCDLWDVHSMTVPPIKLSLNIMSERPNLCRECRLTQSL